METPASSRSPGYTLNGSPAGRRRGRRPAAAPGDGRPGRVRVHARRQGADLPEVGVGQPEPRPLAGRGRRRRRPGSSPGRRAAGDTEANVSEAEKLRRERQRLRETGITQVVRAEEADVAVIPLEGDLYLQRGDGPLERLTETPSPEIDPKLTRDGIEGRLRPRRRAVRPRPGHDARRPSSPRGPSDGLTHGLAEFIAQEEMDRSPASGGRPTARGSPTRRPTSGTSRSTRSSTRGARRTRSRPTATLRRRGQRQGPARRRRRRRAARPAGSTSPTPDDDFYLARVDWESPAIAARPGPRARPEVAAGSTASTPRPARGRSLIEETVRHLGQPPRRPPRRRGDRRDPLVVRADRASGTWSSATATASSSAS